jgi:hypothetical protein
MYISPSKPSGHYMYHQFNIQQFYVLPTQCIYVFCVDLRTKHKLFPLCNINWLIFITETESVYSAVGVRSGHELQKCSTPRRPDCQLQSDPDIWTVSKRVTNRMTRIMLFRDTSICVGESGQQAYWLPQTATRRGDANGMLYKNKGLLKNTVYRRRWSK